MKVYMFKPRFAPLVEAGTKRTTIRPKRKRPPKVGDFLSLRTWTGRPYRSKQKILREAVCLATVEIRINVVRDGDANICWAEAFGKLLTDNETEAMALADGFQKDGDVPARIEMYRWFEGEHGLPFEGDLIRW